MTEVNRPRNGLRIGFRIAGLVLWILAFAGLYTVWAFQSERPQTESSPAAAPTARVVADSQPEKPAAPRKLRSAWDQSVADFELTGSDGKKITNQDLLGKPWIVNFIFTRCNYTCPALTASMAKLQEQLKDTDVRLVTITVDPQHDTAKVLSNYGRQFGADPQKWLFLTGKQAEIHRLINESFLLTAAPNPQPVSGFEFAHSNNILLIDAQGKVFDKFLGTDQAAMRKLVRTAKELAAGSAAADQKPAADKPAIPPATEDR